MLAVAPGLRSQLVLDVAEQNGRLFQLRIRLLGGLERGLRLGDLAVFHLDPAHGVERLGVVRFEIDRLLVLGGRLIVILLELVDQPQLVVGVGVVRGELHPFLQEGRQGFVVLVPDVDGGERRARLGIVLFQAQDLLVLLGCLVHQVAPSLQVGELAVGLQRVVVQLDGGGIGVGRGRQVLVVQVGPGQLQLHHGVGGLFLDQLAVLLQCLGEAAAQGVDVGEASPRLLVVRVRGEHLAVFHHRLVQKRLPLVDGGEAEMELGVVGLVAQRLAVVTHGVFVVPGAEQGVAQPLQGHRVVGVFRQAQPVLADGVIQVLGGAVGIPQRQVVDLGNRHRLGGDAGEHALVLRTLVVALATVPLGEQAVNLLVSRVGQRGLLQFAHRLVGLPAGQQQRAEAESCLGGARFQGERLAELVLRLLAQLQGEVAGGQAGVQGGVLREGRQGLAEMVDGELVLILLGVVTRQPRVVARVLALEPGGQLDGRLLGVTLLQVQQAQVAAGRIELRVDAEGLPVFGDRRIGIAAALELEPLQEVAGGSGGTEFHDAPLGLLALQLARLGGKLQQEPLGLLAAVPGGKRPVEPGGEQGDRQKR